MQKLDEASWSGLHADAWKNRIPYLILDARYEKVREDGAVRSQAVLVAIGILETPANYPRCGAR